MKTILVDAMETLVIEGEGIDRSIYELLEQYSNKKLVLTMAPDELMDKWGLNDLPYEVYTSKLNPKKSEPVFYEQVLDHLGVSVSDVVCFEHDPTAVESARSIGIKTHHFDSEKRDLVALKQFLDTHLSS